MIKTIKAWFELLSNREKIMIGVLLVLLTGTVAFYGIAQPFSDAMTDARMRYQQAIERQARIEAKVALVSPINSEGKVATKPSRAGSGSIDSFISQSAGEAGFAIGKIDVQNDGSVRMTVESAKPTALFRWLSLLEQRGIATTAISASPGENDTISASLELR